MPDHDQTMSVAEAAARIGTHIDSVRRWIRQGRLEAVTKDSDKAGYRLTNEAVERFIASRAQAQHRPALTDTRSSAAGQLVDTRVMAPVSIETTPEGQISPATVQSLIDHGPPLLTGQGMHTSEVVGFLAQRGLNVSRFTVVAAARRYRVRITHELQEAQTNHALTPERLAAILKPKPNEYRTQWYVVNKQTSFGTGPANYVIDAAPENIDHVPFLSGSQTGSTTLQPGEFKPRGRRVGIPQPLTQKRGYTVKEKRQELAQRAKDADTGAETNSTGKTKGNGKGTKRSSAKSPAASA